MGIRNKLIIIILLIIAVLSLASYLNLLLAGVILSFLIGWWSIKTITKELSQERADFLSTISHKLRNHLTSIKAFTQLLLLSPEKDLKSQVEFLDIINSEVDRLTGLIDDLLDSTKMEEKE